MKINRYIISSMTAGLVLMMPMLESCRTEICYNHYPLADIALTWEQEWERDYGMGYAATWDKNFYGFEYNELRPATSDWVSLVRYTKEGEVTSEKYFPTSGGDLILNSGSDNSFLLYNGDTEYIVLSDIASLPDARATATTRTRSTITYIQERHPGVRSMNPPDILYSAYVENVPHVEVHEYKRLDIQMQPLVYTYLIRYEFEKGIESVAFARGAFAGMAESVYLRDGKTSEETSILLYDCDVLDYGCEARVSSFGVPGFPDKYYGQKERRDVQSPYTLNLEVMLKNGKIVEFNFDVSDQLKNQPRGGVIKVDGIIIEEEQAKPDPVASGFDVELNGWGNAIDIDLPLPPGEKKEDSKY